MPDTVRSLQRILLTGLAAATLLAQHEKENEKAKHPFMTDAARIEAGRKAYLGGCAGCHGPEGGGGRGPSIIERASWHPMTDDNLYATIQKGVGIMPAANLPEDRGWELAAFVRSLTAPAIEVQAPGDPAAGEKLFWSTPGCSNCHRIGGKGGFAGPDLTRIGRTSTLPKLRRSIVDSDFEITPGYQAASLTLRDGEKLTGLVKDRTNYVLQLQLNNGTLRSLEVGKIESLELHKTTTMPTSYKTKLTPVDITNLVSFLRQQGAE